MLHNCVTYTNITNIYFNVYIDKTHILKGFRPQVQNSYFIEHLSMVVSDNILGEKTICPISKNFDSSEKSVCVPVYSLFEIPSNENFFKQFVANSM